MSHGKPPVNPGDEPDEGSFVFRWRKAIASSDLPATCKHVLFTLSLHMSADGSRCFPSYELLADESGLHRATVIRHLERAERAGWFTRTRSKGRSSHTYHPLQPSQAATVAENNGRTERVQPSHTIAQPSLSARQPSHSATRGRHEEEEIANEVVTADLFDAFWSTYPRKAGKPTARTKWNTMTKSHAPEVIVAGAQRWADYWREAETEEQFIPYPATWLNRHQWDDPPPPVVRKATRAQQNDDAAKRIAAALAAGLPNVRQIGAAQ